jgi:hypothetical protein
MRSQLTSFTPATMGALGNGITEMLGKFRMERIERAEAAEDARKVHASELRSGVRALLERFELTRETMASDIQAAREAFQGSRPGRGAGGAPVKPLQVKRAGGAKRR